MFDVGPGEFLLVGALALLLFGGRLPEIARSAGRTLAAVKRQLREGLEEEPPK
jgi:Sec-independent protein translocase protein TatA